MNNGRLKNNYVRAIKLNYKNLSNPFEIKHIVLWTLKNWVKGLKRNINKRLSGKPTSAQNRFSNMMVYQYFRIQGNKITLYRLAPLCRTQNIAIAKSISKFSFAGIIYCRFYIFVHWFKFMNTFSSCRNFSNYGLISLYVVRRIITVKKKKGENLYFIMYKIFLFF